MTRPKYPDGLGKRGRRLWGEVMAARGDFGPGEAILLEEACRMADRLDGLADAIDGDRFYEYVQDEEGSSEQVQRYVLIVNGPLAEARLTATALRGYMHSLGLTKGGVEEPGKTGRGGKRKTRVVGEGEAGVKGDPIRDIGTARQRRLASGDSGA